MASSPLQKGPLGLMSTYALQTLGRQPSAFGDTVVPVAEIAPYYERDFLRLQAVQSTGTAPAPIILQVPSGETWVPHFAHVLLSVDPADVAVFSAQNLFVLPNSATPLALASKASPFDPVTNTYRARIMEYAWPMKTLLLPGDAVQGSISAVSNFTQSATLSFVFQYLRLPT